MLLSSLLYPQSSQLVNWGLPSAAIEGASPQKKNPSGAAEKATRLGGSPEKPHVKKASAPDQRFRRQSVLAWLSDLRPLTYTHAHTRRTRPSHLAWAGKTGAVRLAMHQRARGRHAVVRT
ncbi:uncharacterized protein PSANT_01280 [Moesziomyces antarcticus]|uniref:Uncharacterized protein n=1 Tax=Pseudozyma antarctica TaxID=84753 RepID=A0A5C3FIK7_PSEA2|nr:uncharacterized protein PSANT_01280 [Moesziomyces antarcticus]